MHRYLDKWQESTKRLNRFQRRCIGDATATSTQNADTAIAVVRQTVEPPGRGCERTGIMHTVPPPKCLDGPRLESEPCMDTQTKQGALPLYWPLRQLWVGTLTSRRHLVSYGRQLLATRHLIQ